MVLAELMQLGVFGLSLSGFLFYRTCLYYCKEGISSDVITGLIVSLLCSGAGLFFVSNSANDLTENYDKINLRTRLTKPVDYLRGSLEGIQGKMI